MERLAQRLPRSVPDGDVERAQRTVQQTARAHTVTATCVIFTLTPGRYAASAGTSASRRPKAGSRSELLSARSIAQNDAWFVVTTGFLNSRSQAATDDMVGKLPPGTTKASISGRSTLANASRAFCGPSLPIAYASVAPNPSSATVSSPCFALK